MVAELIAKMSADFGRQIIISTHNDFLAQTCNQIYVSMGENNESKVVNYKAE
jgi:ABC-type lipoprotein export system ATPase subunit